MAAADYRLCDCCNGKVFYDSNLNYEFGEVLPSGHMKVDYLGDWAVICEDCAKTHKTMVLTNEQAAALATPPVASGALPELPEPTIDGTVYHQVHKICYTAPVHFTADQVRAYGQACHAVGRGAAVREYIDNGSFAAAAAPNAALVEALKGVLKISRGTSGRIILEQSDEDAIRAALAQAGAA